MNIFITGVAGFIGSHLADKMIKDGHNVIGLDDLSTGNIKNIKHLLNNPSFQFFNDSILNKKIVNELVSKSDLVYHLAAVVGVNLIMKQPLNTLKVNVGGTEILLEAAYKYRKKIVLTSSSEIYGRGVNEEFNEKDDRLIGPIDNIRWGYASSKTIDEFFAFSYFIEHNLPVSIARLFNTVGSRQTGNYGMVLPRFILQALKGDAITVYGDGKQSRCFCNIKDVIHALDILGKNSKANGEVFNVGSKNEISMLNLAKVVIQKTKSNSKIKIIPYSDVFSDGFEDMMRRKPDISKIENYFNWKPSITLESSINQIIKFLKSNKT
jgi:UDP-glucose 4-epimerase